MPSRDVSERSTRARSPWGPALIVTLGCWLSWESFAVRSAGLLAIAFIASAFLLGRRISTSTERLRTTVIRGLLVVVAAGTFYSFRFDNADGELRAMLHAFMSRDETAVRARVCPEAFPPGVSWDEMVDAELARAGGAVRSIHVARGTRDSAYGALVLTDDRVIGITMPVRWKGWTTPLLCPSPGQLLGELMPTSNSAANPLGN